jgi:hypothetical protein
MQPEPSSDEEDLEIQRLADAFTEEYIDILMKEIEESDQYVIA